LDCLGFERFFQPIFQPGKVHFAECGISKRCILRN